jgi:alpha/beta superfamily hydrolase
VATVTGEPALSEESLRLYSDGLALEARLLYPDHTGVLAGRVLLCPPHPFLGGDMDNNVIAAFAPALAEAGFAVLRFNYRGIGASESARDLAEDQQAFWEHSTCPRYEAEITRDCAAAFDALPALVPGSSPPVVIGYSFGALPALRIAQRAPLAALGLVSPPLARWDLEPSALALDCPRLLVYAPGDFACPAARMADLHRAAGAGCELHELPEADHFFIGFEPHLCRVLTQFLARL